MLVRLQLCPLPGRFCLFCCMSRLPAAWIARPIGDCVQPWQCIKTTLFLA